MTLMTLKWRVSFLMVALLMVCGVISAQSSAIKIVYGLTLSVSGFDPHINQSSELGIVLRQVYDTLVYHDPTTDEFVAGLAESWEISPDGLVYTFKLRQGVLFHDGTTFNAQAVAANLDRIVDPALSSQKAKLLLGTYTSYEVVDEFTIRLNLSAPYSPLLDSLAQVYLGIASPTALQTYASDPVLYQFHQIGTGPFIFVEYLPEDHLTLRRNPAYAWGPTFYDVAGNVEEVEFRFYTDPATRLLALQSGEVQIMGEILPTNARTIGSDSSVVLEPVTIPGQPMQFYFNTAKSPTDRLEFRQALILAANRTAIIESVFQGFSPVAWSPLTSATRFYDASLFGAYNFNTVESLRLLDGIGFTDSNNDGIREANGEPIRITLVQPPWGLVPQVAQLLKDQWRDIGIETTIVAVPGFTGLLDEVSTGNYNLVEFESSGLDPALLNARFKSGVPGNWTGFASADLDSLLDQATATTDNIQRQALYNQIQTAIMQQALILPIRDIVNINAHSQAITGLQYDSYGWFPLLYGVSYSQP